MPELHLAWAPRLLALIGFLLVSAVVQAPLLKLITRYVREDTPEANTLNKALHNGFVVLYASVVLGAIPWGLPLGVIGRFVLGAIALRAGLFDPVLNFLRNVAQVHLGSAAWTDRTMKWIARRVGLRDAVLVWLIRGLGLMAALLLLGPWWMR